MKKFYFLMTALSMSVAANAADWYLVGANYGWTDAAANKFEATADANVFTKTVDNLSGTIKIKEAEVWNTSFSSNGDKLKEGVSYSASKDGGDITVDGSIANATITINVADYTILVTGKASENEYSEVYLIGDFGDGWSESLTSYPLTSTNGTTFTGTYDLTAETTYFKMKAGSLVYGTGNVDIAVELGESYTASQFGNAFSIGAGEYTFTFELAKNADTGVLTVTGKGDTPNPPVIDTNPFQLHGQITGVATWETIDLTKNAEGNWEYTGTFVPGEFGLKEVDGSAYGKWIGGNANITEADKAYSFTAGENSTSTLEGTYTFVYNPTASTVTFIPYQGEIEIVKGYALRGTIVSGEWENYALTENNGVWETTLTVIPGEFGIQYTENGSQKGWFSAPSAAEAVVAEAGTYTAAGIGGTNWESSLEGQYTFKFNPETEKLEVVKVATGIDTIIAEDAEAVYYNLQGVRVANPENGLYIRVAGKTASKVYIR